MKIVKFKDGKYGIKRGWWIFTEYRDMDGWDHWWSYKDHVERNAKTESLETCERIYNRLIAKAEDIVLDSEVVDIEQEKVKIRSKL